ncbi:MAG: hypothetical protein AAGF27_07155 [Pseudomonadota bacterium]
MKVIKTELSAGIWQGIVTDTSAPPDLRITHHNCDVSGVTVMSAPEENSWILQIPIPNEAISDGMQTLVISDAKTDETLECITVMAGEALNEDLRAEVDLLRAELDMLKRAFRRHCVETERATIN